MMQTFRDNQENQMHSGEETIARHDMLGVLAERYRFIKELGHGAQATVYLAERLSDHTRVAIKRLRIGSVKSWKEYELFHREAEVLSSLNIDGIARFYEATDDFTGDDPCSYIVQEYIQGRSLQEMIQSGSRFSIDRIYEIILQLIDLLEQLHTHEPPIIHRDLKPSNVILRPREGAWYQVCLIDFGAVSNPQVQGGGSTVAGTLGYMPPEQLTGKPTPASDIYALGAIAVYMLSGKSPADMPVKDFHLIFEPDMQNMMPAVVETLRQMLEPDSAKRLCDYDILRNRFKDFQQSKFELSTEFNDISKYNDTLQNVSFYGEPGNIELWQRLSDRTPRDVPANYRDMFLQTIERHRLLPRVTERDNDVHANLGIIGLPLVYALVILIVFLICFYIFIPMAFWIFAWTVIIPVIFIIIIAKLCIKHKLFVEELPDDMAKRIKKYQKFQDIKNALFQNGRKCIATIVQIEYIPHPHALVENGLKKHFFYRKLNKDEIQKVMEHHASTLNLGPVLSTIKLNCIDDIQMYNPKYCHTDRILIRDFDYPFRAYYAAHGSPMFRITYAFNPPDDEKREDLIHSIITHIEPEEHYKVGDPFPILYRIHRDAKGIEHVDSMPFPIPLGDITELKDVVHAG